MSLQSAADDGGSVEPEATEALDAGLVAEEVIPADVVDQSVADVRKVFALDFGTGRNVARPGAVALT